MCVCGATYAWPRHPHSFLDVSFNRLTCLPACLGRLTGLAVLNGGFNPLGPSFPDVLCCLSGLRELNVDHTGEALSSGWHARHVG